MGNYQEARVKPTSTQLNKLKSAMTIKTGTILQINKKNFEDEELLHELFLTTRQTSKIRNVFSNNMSANIKLSKAQKARKNTSTDRPCYSCSWRYLPGLVNNLASNARNKSERKISKKGAIRVGKRFTLFISNEDMNYINWIILIDGVT